MLFNILKAFDYSPDGLTVVPLTPESPSMPIRADIRQGLLDAKLIEAAAASAPALRAEQLSAVVIPDDWASLKPAALKALVEQLGAKPKDKAAAEAAISAELARRVANA
jgi:hypothetical protein